MTIKTENGIKYINGRSLNQIRTTFENNKATELKHIQILFGKINSEQNLVKELKQLKNDLSPVSILLIIKSLCNFSLGEANAVLETVIN